MGKMETLTDEQKEQLKEKLKGMSSEEIKEILKEQCLFCNISNEKIDSSKIYDDKDVMAVLDINPATKGHCLVFLREHFQFLGEIPEEKIGKLFSVVNRVSSKLIEKLKSSGVNVFIANGAGAGQVVPHIVVHVIPRFEDDGLIFKWEGKKVSKEELNKLSKELRIEKIERKVEEVKVKKEKVKKFENVRIA